MQQDLKSQVTHGKQEIFPHIIYDQLLQNQNTLKCLIYA